MKKILFLILCIMFALPFTVFADGTDVQVIVSKTELDDEYSVNLQLNTQAEGAVVFVYGSEEGNYKNTLSFNPQGEYREYYIHYSEYKDAIDGMVDFNIKVNIPKKILINNLYITVVDMDGNVYNLDNADMPGLASTSELEFVSNSALLGEEVTIDPGSVYSFYAQIKDKYGNVFQSSNLKFELGQDAPSTVQLIDNTLTIDYKKDNVNKSFKVKVSLGDISKEITVNVSDKYTSESGNGSGGGDSSSSSSKRSSIGGISVPVDMTKSGNNIDTPFKDLRTDAWYYDDIIELYDRGLLNGSDGFVYPDDNISREEICAMIVRALNLTSSDISSVLNSDDTVSDWAKSSVSIAVSNGIIQGDGNSVNGNASSTREQAFVMLARAFNLTGSAERNEFSDNADISEWAKESISIMSGCGYVKGDDGGNVMPKSNITRAEFFAVVLRMVNELNK